MEPFDTFRAEPRRFAIGLPVVFGGSLVLAALLVEVSFSLALAVLLAVQTGGCLALYLPALGRRRRRRSADADADDFAHADPGVEDPGAG